jgi:hypothetical protein
VLTVAVKEAGSDADSPHSDSVGSTDNVCDGDGVCAVREVVEEGDVVAFEEDGDGVLENVDVSVRERVLDCVGVHVGEYVDEYVDERRVCDNDLNIAPHGVRETEWNGS